MENLSEKEKLGLDILRDLMCLNKDILKLFSQRDEKILKVWEGIPKKIGDLAMME